MSPKIVLLAGSGDTTNILYNALVKDFNIEAIILEDSIPKKEFIKKRIKQLGIWKVSGQILFQVFIVKCLNVLATKRKKYILTQFNLENKPLPGKKYPL